MVTILRSLLEETLGKKNHKATLIDEQIDLLRGDVLLTATTNDLAKLATVCFPGIFLQINELEADHAWALPGSHTTRLITFKDNRYYSNFIIVTPPFPNMTYSFRRGNQFLREEQRANYVSFAQSLYDRFSIPQDQ